MRAIPGHLPTVEKVGGNGRQTRSQAEMDGLMTSKLVLELKARHGYYITLNISNRLMFVECKADE